ncbi:MAG: hypothetical protein AB7S97_02130, partial [Thermoplasmata archaeon]
MTDSRVAGNIARQLNELSPGSAVSLQMSVDSYLDVMSGVIDLYAGKRDMDTIYVTATISFEAIKRVMQALEID